MNEKKNPYIAIQYIFVFVLLYFNITFIQANTFLPTLNFVIFRRNFVQMKLFILNNEPPSDFGFGVLVGIEICTVKFGKHEKKKSTWCSIQT